MAPVSFGFSATSLVAMPIEGSAPGALPLTLVAMGLERVGLFSARSGER